MTQTSWSSRVVFKKNILRGSNGNVMEGPNRYCQPRRTAVRFFLWGSLWHHCDKSMNGTSWYIPKKNKAVVNLTPCLHGKKQWTLQQAMFDCERVANVVKPIANHPINYPWLGGIKNLIPVIGFFSGYTQCPKPLLGMVFLVIQFSHNYTPASPFKNGPISGLPPHTP